MNNKKFLMVAVGVFVLIVGYLLSSGSVNELVNKLGSVNRSNEYSATSTVPTGASVNKSTLVSNSSAVFGSVTISSTTNATFVVKNASSTSDVSSTTLATFAASSANGTYTFDAVAERGLILEIPAGFAGSYTITYR